MNFISAERRTGTTLHASWFEHAVSILVSMTLLVTTARWGRR